MIQPNEIRIGNILNYTTDEDGLFTTTIDWQDIKYCIEKNKDFNRHHSPIPLTEEVLLKCGFAEKTNKVYPTFSKNELDLVSIRGEYFRAKPPIDVEIKSLHQLQNLFFALEGKELEYKREKLYM
jgi:hypothetical protein